MSNPARFIIIAAADAGDAPCLAPSPAEIAAACAAFQATWSETEKNRRAGIVPARWEVPECESPPDLTGESIA